MIKMRNLCETLCGWHKELSESNPIPSVLVAIGMREFNCTLNYEVHLWETPCLLEPVHPGNSQSKYLVPGNRRLELLFLQSRITEVVSLLGDSSSLISVLISAEKEFKLTRRGESWEVGKICLRLCS
jgi:hypothetical protein